MGGVITLSCCPSKGPESTAFLSKCPILPSRSLFSRFKITRFICAKKGLGNVGKHKKREKCGSTKTKGLEIAPFSFGRRTIKVKKWWFGVGGFPYIIILFSGASEDVRVTHVLRPYATLSVGRYRSVFTHKLSQSDEGPTEEREEEEKLLKNEKEDEGKGG